MHVIARLAVVITAVAAAAAVCLSGCAHTKGGTHSPLFNHWVYYEGALNRKLYMVDFKKDGTAIINGFYAEWNWKRDSIDTIPNRLVVEFPEYTIRATYRLSGQELIFVYDDGDSALFVRKKHYKRYERMREKIIEREEAEYYIIKRGKVVDARDGRLYKTVRVAGKWWMSRNLNYKPESGNSWCYNNDESMCAEYGRLYDWETAKTVCMPGLAFAVGTGVGRAVGNVRRQVDVRQ